MMRSIFVIIDQNFRAISLVYAKLKTKMSTQTLPRVQSWNHDFLQKIKQKNQIYEIILESIA